MLRILQLFATLHLDLPAAPPEVRQFPVEADLPVEAHQYLVGERQRGEGLLLDRLSDLHAQGDDARPTVRTRSFSTASHSCNKIGHHSDSYYCLRLEIRVPGGGEGGATNVM